MTGSETVHTYWQTIACQAAPPGWRLLSIVDENPQVIPIAAWLVQEGHRYRSGIGPDSDDSVPPESGLEARVGLDTRVVPGVCARDWGWEVHAIDAEDGSEIWKVLGPGQSDPTDEEWTAEIARRRERHAE